MAKNLKKSCFYTFNFTAYHNNNSNNSSNTFSWAYPWGCGLTFASNMLRNFDYVLFSHSSQPHCLRCKWRKKVRKIGRNAPYTYEACVFAQWITFRWIQHGFNRFDPFLSFPLLKCMWAWVSVRVQHFNTSNSVGSLKTYCDVVTRGFVLMPPHYPVIQIKCVETKRTMRYNISQRTP